jgi:histone-lysine N-methyltransferase SETD1
LIAEVVDHVVNELKEIIKRDIKKKMIESTGFKSYESWWDDNETKNRKTKADPLLSSAPMTPAKTSNNLSKISEVFAACSGLNLTSNQTLQRSFLSSGVNSVTAAPVQEPTAFAGLGLGLGRLIPKMPSFRRKFKAPSPVPEDDWGNDDEVSRGSGPPNRRKNVDTDDDSENKDENNEQVVQKNRSAAVIDSSSDSDDDIPKDREQKKKGGSIDSDSDASDGSSRPSADSDDERRSSTSGDSLKGSSDSSSDDDASSSEDSEDDLKRRKKKSLTKSRPKIVSDADSDSEVERSEVEDEAFQEESLRPEDENSQGAMAVTKSAVNEDEEPEEDKLAAEALMALAGFSDAKPSQDDASQESQEEVENGIDSDTDSAPELDQLDKEFRQPVTAVDYDHCYAMPKKPIYVAAKEQSFPPSSLDSTIDDVVKGVFETTPRKKSPVKISDKSDRETFRDENNKKAPNKIPKKSAINRNIEGDLQLEAAAVIPVRPIASEWRKAKDKNVCTVKSSPVDSFGASPFYDARSPARIVTPKPVFQPRSVVDEMGILYAFLKDGIDEEDIECLKRSYEKMLTEETAHAWLHDTHWVDHPATLIPDPDTSFPSNKKRKKEHDVRIHSTGSARSQGFYKMDEKEKRQHSHVANIRADEAEMEAKILRARGAIVQTSTREARSNQRRLLATVDAAWSDLLKFNQLQVRYFSRLLVSLLIEFFFRRKTVPKEATEVCSK